FGCDGLRLNDTNRTVTLLLINTLRSRVALGHYFDIPSAAHMNKLAWNCGLERLAEEAIANCSEMPPMNNGFINGT
ncbi:hypothetical protein KIN20_030033, partial [Parelaphostrongylus tenuis]